MLWVGTGSHTGNYYDALVYLRNQITCLPCLSACLPRFHGLAHIAGTIRGVCPVGIFSFSLAFPPRDSVTPAGRQAAPSSDMSLLDDEALSPCPHRRKASLVPYLDTYSLSNPPSNARASTTHTIATVVARSGRCAGGCLPHTWEAVLPKAGTSRAARAKKLPGLGIYCFLSPIFSALSGATDQCRSHAPARAPSCPPSQA